MYVELEELCSARTCIKISYIFDDWIKNHMFQVKFMFLETKSLYNLNFMLYVIKFKLYKFSVSKNMNFLK